MCVCVCVCVWYHRMHCNLIHQRFFLFSFYSYTFDFEFVSTILRFNKFFLTHYNIASLNKLVTFLLFINVQHLLTTLFFEDSITYIFTVLS